MSIIIEGIINEDDKRRFLEEGKKSEKFVMNLLEKTFEGSKCKFSSKFVDMTKHIDFYWDRPSKERISVDAKGPKKEFRSDKYYLSDKVWVETLNIDGNKGWVYGEADCIAFTLADRILFVKRQELADLVEEKTKNKTVTNYHKRGELYTPYQRYLRKDSVVLVPVSDIEKLNHFVVTI